ncbi:MAG TPA: class A beta-lactamase-related serine hydrolase [Myxococcota bacterium]|nr:serine hydrolase [Myxococcota bacterium]HNZ03255.1 class A beta-lactamase-related serine hydrolase [Myxococcota bacterium]HOD06582.1 class A beta-lactamase-related serine hydrolase [Myxococcota bacterium]
MAATTPPQKKKAVGKSIALVTILLAVAMAVAASGWVAYVLKPCRKVGVVETRDTSRELISPLLECGLDDQFEGKKLTELKSTLNRLVQTRSSSGPIDRVSVYFRDLNNGPWIGIGESETFSPASLLKVPVMMGILRKAELEPGFLEQREVYQIFSPGAGEVLQDVYKPLLLVEGMEYSILELVEQMIAESDNNATRILATILGDDGMKATYAELGLPVPDFDGATPYEMTAKQYASFFRILFNASWLNREHSELALNLLTRTRWSQGLRAGVPLPTKVAHKFGHRASMTSTSIQLHDCGIVYAPEKPYLICVMISGRSLNAEADLLAEISRETWRVVTTPD